MVRFSVGRTAVGCAAAGMARQHGPTGLDPVPCHPQLSLEKPENDQSAMGERGFSGAETGFPPAVGDVPGVGRILPLCPRGSVPSFEHVVVPTVVMVTG